MTGADEATTSGTTLPAGHGPVLTDRLGVGWWLAREMSDEQLRAVLYRMAHDLGGQNKLAAALGASVNYLSDVMRGNKAPGPAITDPMGLERVVTYRVKTPNVEFSGVPAGHSSNHHAGGTSAGTQG